MDEIRSLKEKILAGGEIEVAEAMRLAHAEGARLTSLLDAAAEITAALHTRKFDSCSIINARSGRCPEDCKWCAQSAHYHTKTSCHGLVDRDTCIDLALYNQSQGVGRFSMVTSGRRLAGEEFDRALSYMHELSGEHSVRLCASMGLLDEDQLRRLREAGVTRYHCNLETAPSHFGSLCSTHTIDQKMETLRLAREAGLEVCSGGIIGMGESLRQRLELAAECRDAGAVSIPVNLLNPIKGTPLEGTPLISEPDVVLTVALMRLVAPCQSIRFAGGRARCSQEATARMLRGGVNGAIVGDMLTTIGNAMDEDRRLFASVGLRLH